MRAATITESALECLNNRLSVIPIKPGSKVSSINWKPYMATPMTPMDAERHFVNGCNLALIGGAVSGNLECLDFDKPDLFKPFADTLESINSNLKNRLTVWQETPSGGFHLLYRCTEAAGGSTKLAMGERYQVDGITKQDTWIETRGEGGYFLVSPSTVGGKGYTLHGDLAALPVITGVERDLLHGIAKSFDEGTPQGQQYPKGDTATGERPGDRYNQVTDGRTLLEGYGWRYLRTIGDREHWQRPGKEGIEASATLNSNGLFVFSTSTPLPDRKPLDKFGVFAWYEHGGDFAAAARAIGGQEAYKATPSPPHGEEWPEPSPLTVQHQADPYPLDALPGTIGEAVREVVGFVQCPVALGACSALAVVSTVAQGLVDVRRADKLEGPTSLFLLAIADSGERKTTVDAFFSKPVDQWGAEQQEAAKPEVEKYEAESAAWDAEKSGLLAAIKEATKGGKSTDDFKERLTDLEREKPEAPKVPRLLFGDSTPEALAHRLAHGWPVGGVLSSEAGIVFGGHAMGKDSAMRNMSMLNSLWGAETLTIDRRSAPSYTLRGARLTMGLAVQSETVRAFLDSSKGLARGIGFLARFLIAWPESTQGGRMFKDPPETWPHLAKFHRRLGALLDNPLAFNEKGELETETLELSPEAKAVWVAFHDDVETELRPGRDMAEARDVASKAADNAARLAALFHLFENDPGGTIGPDHMRKAAAVAGWHLYEARRFMGEIARPVEENNAVKLDDWLLRYCQQNQVTEVSTRDAQRLGPNCTREKRSLEVVLMELVEAGRVRVVEGGRRKLVKINPALLRD